MNTLHSDPQIILKAFEKLRADYQRQESQIATKQDIAARKRDKELVEQASTYLPETIFQGLAKLQTSFGQAVATLSEEMTTEADKLIHIQQAIQIESQHVEALHNIQIAAEALNILHQEHQQTLQSLSEEYEQKRETLEREITQQRQAWQKVQQDYEKSKKKQQVILVKTRQSEEEDFLYQSQRQQQEEADNYDKRKRALERQLEEEQSRRGKDWKSREQYLEQNQKLFQEYKTKVEVIPKELDEAVKKAREDAIKETYRDEENKAKLRDKEMEGKRKAFELKIESLQKTVEQQKARIVQLNEQLQSASKQVQQLAMTVVTSGGQKKSSTKEAVA